MKAALLVARQRALVHSLFHTFFNIFLGHFFFGMLDENCTGCLLLSPEGPRPLPFFQYFLGDFFWGKWVKAELQCTGCPLLSTEGPRPLPGFLLPCNLQVSACQASPPSMTMQPGATHAADLLLEDGEGGRGLRSWCGGRGRRALISEGPSGDAEPRSAESSARLLSC